MKDTNYPTFWEPSEEDYRRQYEEDARWLEEDKNKITLYDPRDKDTKTYEVCLNLYGYELANKMLDAKNEKRMLCKQDYLRLMSYKKPEVIREKEKQIIDKTNKINQKEPFMKIYHNTIKNADLRKIMKKSMMLYMYLMSYIVRGRRDDDKLHLYRGYYQHGKLAVSIPVRILAKELDMDKETIVNYLKNLEEHHIIEIDKVQTDSEHDKNTHNIYILGKHDFNSETYFIDEFVALNNIERGE